MINIYYKIKWFIQRGKRGYSDNDVANLNNYLSDVISGSLIQLSKQTKIYPPEYDTHNDYWSNLILWRINLRTIGEGFKDRLNEDIGKRFVKHFNSFWGIF